MAKITKTLKLANGARITFQKSDDNHVLKGAGKEWVDYWLDRIEVASCPLHGQDRAHACDHCRELDRA